MEKFFKLINRWRFLFRLAGQQQAGEIFKRMKISTLVQLVSTDS